MGRLSVCIFQLTGKEFVAPQPIPHVQPVQPAQPAQPAQQPVDRNVEAEDKGENSKEK